MKKLNISISEEINKKNNTQMKLISERDVPLNFFKISQLDINEKNILEEILLRNAQKNVDISIDLKELTKITGEVKSITSQAILLHAQMIKKTQSLLKNYNDNAFTSWLIHTYGNRQTPYNFLQYYELYNNLQDTPLKEKLHAMPKQAAYALASRVGTIEKKQNFILKCSGESKNSILSKLRGEFPLTQRDKRKQNFSEKIITSLTGILQEIDIKNWKPSKYEVKTIEELIKKLTSLLS